MNGETMSEVTDVTVDSQNVIMALALQRNAAMDQLAFWQAKAQQLEAQLAVLASHANHTESTDNTEASQ